MPLLCVPAATHGSGAAAISVLAANCTPAGRHVGSMPAEEFGATEPGPTAGAIGWAAGESGQLGAPPAGPISPGDAVVGVGIGSGVMCVGCGVGIGNGVIGCCGGASGVLYVGA